MKLRLTLISLILSIFTLSASASNLEVTEDCTLDGYNPQQLCISLKNNSAYEISNADITIPQGGLVHLRLKAVTGSNINKRINFNVKTYTPAGMSKIPFVLYVSSRRCFQYGPVVFGILSGDVGHLIHASYDRDSLKASKCEMPRNDLHYIAFNAEFKGVHG